MSAGSSLPISEPRGNRVAAVATVFFANGAVYGSWVPRLPEIRQRVDISLAETGVVLSGAATLALVATLVAGRLSDRFGSRRAVVVSGLTAVLALVGVGAARHPLALVVALAVVSASDVVQDVAMNVQAARLNRRRAVPIMSRLHGLWSLGAVVGGLVAARLAAASISLVGHLTAVALLLAVVTLAAAPSLSPVDDVEPDREGSVPPSRQFGRAGSGLALLGFLAIAIELNPADWSALRLVDDLDASAGPAGLAFGVFSAGMLVGRFGGDAVVHRVGADRALVGGVALAGVGIALGCLAGSVSGAIAGFALAGVGVGPVFPQIYATAAATPGFGAGLGIALMTTGQRVGSLVLPLAVGLVADLDGVTVGGAVAIVTLPCAVALGVVTRPRRRSPNRPPC